MKKTILSIILLAVLSLGCAQKVEIIKFSGIYPGMSCSELETYLKRYKLPFKKDGKNYKFDMAGDVWQRAVVKCDNNVTYMEFSSTSGSAPKYGQAYIDAQEALLNAFRGNRISYEEGNKIINLNNGIKLHQFADTKSGVVTHFIISVESGDESRLAWNKVVPLLPKIGAGR